MNTKTENRYCQSCGMPLNLAKIEYLGTLSDQTSSDEYCYYCLKDGKYIVDYTMEQMLEVWIKYTDKYNEYANTCYQPQELRSLLTERMPNLKRWRQREETENAHFEIVNRVQVYINQHLFESLEAESLSQMAGLSLFHFRRVFREITGENVGSYIQRLRLEYIAYKLIATDVQLSNLIQQVQVYTKFSLSKAFRKHFGLSPMEYRKQFRLTGKNGQEGIQLDLQPRIKRMSSLPILYLQVGDAYNNLKVYRNLWKKLITFAQENKLMNSLNTFISVSLDEPSVTKPEQCRFYLGITVDETFKPSGPFGIMQIKGGLYAIFRHKGSHSLLPGFYRDIYLNWFPAAGYRQSEPLTFERYITTPREVPDSDLITEIYIPIEKIEAL